MPLICLDAPSWGFPPAGSKSSACLRFRLSQLVSFTFLLPTHPRPTPLGGFYCCTSLAFSPAASKSSAYLPFGLSPLVSFTTLLPTQPPPTPPGCVYFSCRIMLQTPENLLRPEARLGNFHPLVHLNIRRHRHGAMDIEWDVESLELLRLSETLQLVP